MEGIVLDPNAGPATLEDPRYAFDPFWVERAKDNLKRKFDSDYGHLTPPLATPISVKVNNSKPALSAQQKLNERIGRQNNVQTAASPTHILDHYWKHIRKLQDPDDGEPDVGSLDPLQWWQAQAAGGRFQALVPLAQSVLCIPVFKIDELDSSSTPSNGIIPVSSSS
ncbi:hypothetical protein BT69DRAFT_1336576 [Atractiella rhizophila]|nr:hypothetical protein BT69DRAFT_1336576 [Atractiella rhizophila]